MDNLEEWEVIPSSTPPHRSKPLPPFLDLFVEADYFRCPTTPPPPATLQQQQEPREEEDDDHAPEFKDIPISTEFSNKDTTPAPLPAATPPPFNWLEPDPVVFGPDSDRSYDMAAKKELVANGKDCAGFNLWSLGLNGIGAICSFGVATAATLCVFALGAASASASHSGRFRPGPNIQFQIYSHDKRIKEVVQRATGLKHAIAATATPGIANIPRAQISFGGHYEGL